MTTSFEGAGGASQEMSNHIEAKTQSDMSQNRKIRTRRVNKNTQESGQIKGENINICTSDTATVRRLKAITLKDAKGVFLNLL